MISESVEKQINSMFEPNHIRVIKETSFQPAIIAMSKTGEIYEYTLEFAHDATKSDDIHTVGDFMKLLENYKYPLAIDSSMFDFHKDDPNKLETIIHTDRIFKKLKKEGYDVYQVRSNEPGVKTRVFTGKWEDLVSKLSKDKRIGLYAITSYKSVLEDTHFPVIGYQIRYKIDEEGSENESA